MDSFILNTFMGETYLSNYSKKTDSYDTNFLFDTNMAVSVCEKSFFDNQVYLGTSDGRFILIQVDNNYNSD